MLGVKDRGGGKDFGFPALHGHPSHTPPSPLSGSRGWKRRRGRERERECQPKEGHLCLPPHPTRTSDGSLGPNPTQSDPGLNPPSKWYSFRLTGLRLSGQLRSGGKSLESDIHGFKHGVDIMAPGKSGSRGWALPVSIFCAQCLLYYLSHMGASTACDIIYSFFSQ